MTDLLCPKCHNIMTRYERNGVVVDQCSGCGGMFLDRGELEHLIQAEAAFYGAGPVAPSGPPGYGVPPRPAAFRDDDRGHEDPRSSKRRKKRGFLEDLLDFD